MSSSKSRIGWLTMALAFATGACLVVPWSAGAATLTFTSITYTFIADAGEADAVQVLPGTGDRFLLSDTADTITLGSGTGCTGGGTNQVDCPDSSFFNMYLSDQSDVAVVNDTVDMYFDLYGGSGDDSLDGGGNDDDIYGEFGNDPTLSGGGGDDWIVPGEGPDGSIDGGTGIHDKIIYDDGRATGVNVNLEAGTGADGETLSGFEDVFGSDYDDTLQGTAGENYMRGEAGADVLIGAGGKDFLHGNNQSTSDGAHDTASYTERATPVVTVIGGAAATHQDFDVYSDITALAGGSGNDRLTGDGVANVLTGNGGADMLFGGADADTLNGNQGDDELYGEGEGDALNGSDGNDLLTGGLGDDTIDGGLDDDTLLGGIGADNLVGGGNTDTVSYQDGRVTGIALDLGVGALPDSDTYTAVDSIIGTEQGDTMTGGAGADDLRGAGGGDTITGAAGVDNLQAQDGDDLVRAKDGQADTVGCGAGTDQVEADGADAQSECETQLGIQPQPPAGPGGSATTGPGIPVNAFRVGKLKGKTLEVNVQAAGTVKVADAADKGVQSARKKKKKKSLGLKPSSATGGPGTIKVKLKLTSAASKALKRSAKVKLKTKITFTPNGGSARSQTKTLKLKGKKVKRGRK